ncbi:MAG TPA: hypothetical protein VGS97_18975 [Actinocrinis sp.]|nr:hypothetical protein [Actinocrinis sp.]HEV2346190.1 hypothetical protein [Actinocrinis sp.]
MNAIVETQSELVSVVSDLRHVPLTELVRAREAQLAAAGQSTAGAFNSSI